MDRRLLLVALCASSLIAAAAQGQIVSGFDSGVEGWGVRDVNCSNFAQSLGTHALSWQSAGGDPGGWVRLQDTTNYCSFFAAPAAYLGNRADYIGGSLACSLNSSVTNWADADVVVLIGAGLVICHELPSMPPAPPAWGRYVVPLQAAAFTYNNEDGAVVSTADFAAVLADLEGLLLPAEFGAQVGEIVGLDSVVLRLPGTPVPGEFPLVGLLSARPNPFNPRTTVTFELPTASAVRLTVHDARGRLVCTLCNDALMPAGRHEVTWQGCGDHGESLPSGAYVIRLAAGDISATTRVLSMK